MNNFGAAGGDPGISFYSASSINDTMMDTSGVVISSHNAKQSQVSMVPPNDKMIHVSKCRNDKCPL